MVHGGLEPGEEDVKDEGGCQDGGHAPGDMEPEMVHHDGLEPGEEVEKEEGGCRDGMKPGE